MAYRQSHATSQAWPDINPNTSGFTPQMPLVVVMGVEAVGQMQPATKPSSDAQQYAADWSQYTLCTYSWPVDMR